MSYSFSVRGTTKNEAMTKVIAQLDAVVAGQPIHAADRFQAQAAVEAFLGVLPSNPDGQEFQVSVHGSVGWIERNIITSAGVGVSANLVAKEKS